jgi:hypothetical protein
MDLSIISDPAQSSGIQLAYLFPERMFKPPEMGKNTEIMPVFILQVL